jgi:hypothetical protein
VKYRLVKLRTNRTEAVWPADVVYAVHRNPPVICNVLMDKNVSDESQREHFKLLFRSIIHAAYANPAETPESFGTLVKFGCNEGQKEQSGTGQ